MSNYCCGMRERFVVGIVGVNEDAKDPPEIVDFAIAFSPRLVIAIKYCPFCAKQIDVTEQQLRIT